MVLASDLELVLGRLDRIEKKFDLISSQVGDLTDRLKRAAAQIVSEVTLEDVRNFMPTGSETQVQPEPELSPIKLGCKDVGSQTADIPRCLVFNMTDEETATECEMVTPADDVNRDEGMPIFLASFSLAKHLPVSHRLGRRLCSESDLDAEVPALKDFSFGNLAAFADDEYWMDAAVADERQDLQHRSDLLEVAWNSLYRRWVEWQEDSQADLHDAKFPDAPLTDAVVK